MILSLQVRQTPHMSPCTPKNKAKCLTGCRSGATVRRKLSPQGAWRLTIPFPDLDPVFIDFGFFQIRWYALAYIAGLVLGWQYVKLLLRTDRLWATKDVAHFPKETGGWKIPFLPLTIPGPRLSFDAKTRKKFGVSAPATADHIDDLLLWAAVGVIAGGRIGYVLFYAMWYEGLREHYFENPLRVFFLWEGGMAFHGGLIGVILAIVWFARRNKLDPFRVGDVVAVATPIGLFFGRIANFINGELWGKVTTVPWGVIFPHPNAGPLPRHPSQLYEATLEGLVLLIILSVIAYNTKAFTRPGLITGIFLIGYAIARTIAEFFRETESYFLSPDNWFTMGMLYSLPMVAVGVGFIWFALRKPAPPTS